MNPKGEAETRQRILDTALSLFASKGFEGTSMRDLAHEVGVSTAALYYHFANKEALLVALISPFLDDIDELLAGGDDLEIFLERYVELLVSHDPLLRLIDLDMGVRVHPAVSERLAGQLETLRVRLAKEATDNGDEEGLLRASAALGAIRRPVNLLHPDEAVARRVLVRAALAVLRSP